MEMTYHYGTPAHTDRRTPDAMTPAVLSQGSDLYDFTRTYPDNRSVLLAVAAHGENLRGVELGLYQANSFCAMLQVCTNVDELIGVDKWEPYEDYIGSSKTPMVRDQKQIEFIRNTAINFIMWSGCADRATILEMDTIQAAVNYEDESMDFVFFDAHLSQQQLVDELTAWYPKIKQGGLVIGHDYHTRETRHAVLDFRFDHNITTPYYNYDQTFIWKKA
jgi:hypothetical protein